MNAITLDLDWLDRLYPAHILIDAASVVQRVGPALQRLCPALTPGSVLHAHVPDLAPQGNLDLADCARRRDPVQLALANDAATLIGSVIAQGSGFLLAMNVAAGLDALEDGTFSLADFAPDDPIVPGLLLSGIQKALLAESEQVAEDLHHERQRASELVQRIQRAAGYVAHDFSNFLSIISLNCRRIRADENLSDRQKRCLDIVLETAGRGSEITRSLVTLSQSKTTTDAPIDIHAFMRRNAALFSSIARTGVDVRLDISDAQVHVAVSSGALMNCIVNLLINAREAMPSGGSVVLSSTLSDVCPSTGARGRFVLLQCQDTGIGMDDETQARAFDLFFTTKRRGSGIGLASVKDFAAESGGNVMVRSRLGAGTCVTIILPLVPPGPRLALDEADTTAPATLPESARCRHRVLIVEDEAYALEALSELLADDDFIVSSALSAAEAKRCLDEQAHDLLLTDVVMPGESGIELALWVADRYPDTRIMLMSGFVPEHDTLQPDWRYIRKPLDSQRLCEMIRAALSP